MAEIVCTNCSQGFESEAGEEKEVACPACGHTQSVSAAREAEEKGDDRAEDPGSSEETPTTSDADPFDGFEEEMVFDMDDEGSTNTETADFGAVLPRAAHDETTEEPSDAQPEVAPEAEAAPAPSEPEDEPEAEATPAPEDEPEVKAAPEGEPEGEAALAPEDEPEVKADPEEEDTRWRFRSGSGLVLFFPTYEVASKWVIKQNPADISIAYGAGEFRPYSSFEAQLKTIGDPVAAIRSELSEVEPVAEETPGEGPSESFPEVESSTEISDPAMEVSPPSETSHVGESGNPRTMTMTSEFQFRTGKDVNVWPGRIIFLVLGLLLGGGGVYYAAWYGLLPGILY